MLRSRTATAVLTLVLVLRCSCGAGAQAASSPTGPMTPAAFATCCRPGRTGSRPFLRSSPSVALGALPPHFADQQPLYENLVYGSPTLTDAQVPDFFKDATFGVPPGQAASTVNPRPGVTIVRDSAYGVPHIYGDTRADTMFGAGYAGAADRLFLMDVLRHTGRRGSLLLPRWLQCRDGRAAVGLRSLHRGRPAAPGRPAVAALWRRRTAVGRRRAELRRRDQCLHRGGERRPGAEAGRVPAAQQADRAMENDRRGRDRLAGRRHLRPGRRQRAELRPDDAVLRRALRP